MTPREVAEAYLASFANGDPGAISAWVTDDFVNEHTSALGSGCVGRDDYRARLGGFLASFAGVTYDVEDLLTDGRRVVAVYTLRARWQGEDGPPVQVRGVQRLLVRDGLIARRVDYWDSLQFLFQVDPSVRDALAAWL